MTAAKRFGAGAMESTPAPNATVSVTGLPRGTIRIQLHEGYTLNDAVRELPYFRQLGVSHLYLSPVSRSRIGSTHGYDIVDHTTVDQARGGEAALRRLSEDARRAGMGILLDIVPNHMATDPDNAWWWDVLANGRESRWAQWFDIDWESSVLRGKVLAPFLDKPYPNALQSGDILLAFSEARGLHITAHGVPYPLAPGSIQQRNDVEALLRAHDPKLPEGRQRLHALLARQHYCLAWWHRAADLINWRRFFEVSGLIGVRVEHDEVFDAVHALVLRLYAEGVIDGLRVDHVDGLAQPLNYCRQLHAAMEAARKHRPAALRELPIWIVVEKILAPGEELDERWSVSGTTGYDFAADVGALLHDAAGEGPLLQAWAQINGDDRRADALLAEVKQELLDRHFIAERQALLHILLEIAQGDDRAREWPQWVIGAALDALLSHYPTYRSYVEAGRRNPADQRWFDMAGRGAMQALKQRGEPAWPYDEILAWLNRILGAAPPVTDIARKAVQRFQQLTPPLAAKALEDTLFYRYGPLLSRNEVGSDPSVFSISTDSFHERNIRRAAMSPFGLLATATHDHNRGEDVRARLAVLSEIPEEWCEISRSWLDQEVDSAQGMAPGIQYMLLQTLVGAWPPGLKANDTSGVDEYLHRIGEWLIKALREGKQYSSWFHPDTSYEAVCKAFLERMAPGGPTHHVLVDIERFVRRIEPAAILNGLVQVALRFTCPGVPDLYQGTEYRDFTLVDPDNRSPVDFELRRRTLSTLPLRDESGEAWSDGRVKQAMVATLLQLRRERADSFYQDYRPLPIDGASANAPLLAFARGPDVVVIAGLKFATAVQMGSRGPELPTGHWADVSLALPGSQDGWRDVLRATPLPAASGQRRVADLLRGRAVAVLCRDQG